MVESLTNQIATVGCIARGLSGAYRGTFRGVHTGAHNELIEVIGRKATWELIERFTGGVHKGGS